MNVKHIYQPNAMHANRHHIYCVRPNLLNIDFNNTFMTFSMKCEYSGAKMPKGNKMQIKLRRGESRRGKRMKKFVKHYCTKIALNLKYNCV